MLAYGIIESLQACGPQALRLRQRTSHTEMHQSVLSRLLASGDHSITKCYKRVRLAIITEIICRNLTLFYNMLAYGFSASIWHILVGFSGVLFCCAQHYIG